jgi:hydroxymethylglutaryl-CoA lyase
MNRERVSLCEVGPRDGLQNEPHALPPSERARFISRLAAAGLECIEAGAFVSPRAVPQMAGTAQVLAALKLDAPPRLPVLVANQRGLDDALRAGVREIALFTGASDAFTLSNIRCDVASSLMRFAGLASQASAAGLRMRGYVSVAFGCPFEGAVKPERVLHVAESLLALGCEEISIGDTIGVATPSAVERVFRLLEDSLPVARLAGHFHDTRGMAVANVCRALELGVRSFDASVGGLGGCPYAPGASGNVATEDLVYLFEGEGMETGVDLQRLMAAGEYIDRLLGRRCASRVRAASAGSLVRR